MPYTPTGVMSQLLIVVLGVCLCCLCASDCRGSQRSAVDEKLLLFWPWFVECAFQKHYRCTTLHLVDAVSLPVSLVIWVACIFSCTPWQLVTVLPPMTFEAWVWYHKYNQPERYNKRRTVLTAMRRLGIIPYLGFVQLRRPFHASSSWQSAIMLLWIGSGSGHTLVATFIFLNSWWVAIAEGVAAFLLLAPAAPSSCASVLSGPYAAAGWPTAAAVMDRATLGIWRRSLAQPDMAHAVCCTTLNTMLVSKRRWWWVALSVS